MRFAISHLKIKMHGFVAIAFALWLAGGCCAFGCGIGNKSPRMFDASRGESCGHHAERMNAPTIAKVSFSSTPQSVFYCPLAGQSAVLVGKKSFVDSTSAKAVMRRTIFVPRAENNSSRTSGAQHVTNRREIYLRWRVLLI